MNEFDKLLSYALKAASVANGVIMQYYGRVDCKLKEDKTPLTQADLAAHSAITEVLADSLLPVCSEEGVLDYETRRTLEAFWLIDPLDGTKDFLAKNDNFTTNIALIYRNKPAIGVIGVPATGDLYYAVLSQGAYKKTKDGLFPLNGESRNLNPIACDSIHHSTEEIHRFLSFYNLESRRIGSALKFCALASGEVDIYPRFNGSSEWDSAAGDLIVSESGGIVLSLLDRKPLVYNKPSLRNPHFIGFSKVQIQGEIYEDFLAGKGI